jgi:Rrf2 family transcriptional regulator, nitric oxide-sensitive transcriptional repressor
MKLSKQVSDAIRILVVCHRANGKLVKVGEVADELNLTKQIALKTANVVAQAGFLDTVRGPSGGIRLSERAKTATIGSIVRALETMPSPDGKGSRAAGFAEFLEDAFAAFLDVLDQHSLADLAKQRTATGRKRAGPKKRPAKKAAPGKAVAAKSSVRVRSSRVGARAVR